MADASVSFKGQTAVVTAKKDSAVSFEDVLQAVHKASLKAAPPFHVVLAGYLEKWKGRWALHYGAENRTALAENETRKKWLAKHKPGDAVRVSGAWKRTKGAEAKETPYILTLDETQRIAGNGPSAKEKAGGKKGNGSAAPKREGSGGHP